MVTMEKILQTKNSWQWGEVIAMRRKKCSGASSHPNPYTYWYMVFNYFWAENAMILAKNYFFLIFQKSTFFLGFLSSNSKSPYGQLGY